MSRIMLNALRSTVVTLGAVGVLVLDPGSSAAGPLSDTWGYRLTASYINDEGYMDNLYNPALVDPGANTLNDCNCITPTVRFANDPSLFFQTAA